MQIDPENRGEERIERQMNVGKTPAWKSPAGARPLRTRPWIVRPLPGNGSSG